MMPDTASARGSDNFGADHYKPKETFPRLATEYSNLYYCCNACNSRKGKYWPEPEHLKTRFIPNPCEYEMFRHLRFRLATVEPKSESGRFASTLLDLNDPEVVKSRALIISTIEIYEEKIREYLNIAAKIRAKLKAGELTQQKADDGLKRIDAKIAEANDYLSMLSGRQ